FEVAIVTSSGVPQTRSELPVTLALSGSGSGLSGTLTVQAVRGVATFSDVRLSEPGPARVLTASVPTLPLGESSRFDVLAAGSPRLAFKVQPGFTHVNVPFAPSIEVEVLDA